MIGAGRLSLNQATVRHLTAAAAADLCARHEIPGIGLWRNRVAELGLAKTAAVTIPSFPRKKSGMARTMKDPAVRTASNVVVAATKPTRETRLSPVT